MCHAFVRRCGCMLCHSCLFVVQKHVIVEHVEVNQGEPNGNMQITTFRFVFQSVVMISNGNDPMIPLVLVPFSSLRLAVVGWRLFALVCSSACSCLLSCTLALIRFVCFWAEELM